MTVYLDTGPLFALVEARDQGHTRALAAFEKLDTSNVQVLCPYPAALELHRLLLTRKPSAPQQAHQVALRTLETFTLALAVLEDINEAKVALRRYGDQKISLTDATIASMAKRAGAQVLTFDHRHFDLMGASVFE